MNKKTLPIYAYRGRLWATTLPDPCSNEARARGFALDGQLPAYALFSASHAQCVGRVSEKVLNIVWSQEQQDRRVEYAKKLH